MEKAFPSFLSQPAQRALQGAGVLSLQDCTRYSQKELAKLHGMGPNAMKKLEEAMQQHGLTFRSEP